MVALNPSDDDPDAPQPDASEFHIQAFEPESYRKLCLARLAGFVSLRAHPLEEPVEDALLHRRIADRAIYSAFRDCIAAGAEEDARRILDAAAAHA